MSSSFMGQLTLARFRGDTTFGLVARILSTFLGGVAGMVMWYAFDVIVLCVSPLRRSTVL